MSVLRDAGEAGKGDSAFKGRKGGHQGRTYELSLHEPFHSLFEINTVYIIPMQKIPPLRGFCPYFAGGESNCYKIVKMILERNFAPVIVFSFSKKDCEAYAMQMSKIDFNTGDLCFLIQRQN